MADNTQQRGGQDRARINVNQDYELRDWSEKYGVTPEVLKEAVKAVGDRAEAVEAHLRRANSERSANGPHVDSAGSGNSLGRGDSGRKGSDRAR